MFHVRKGSMWRAAIGTMLMLSLILTACGPTPEPETIVTTVENKPGVLARVAGLSEEEQGVAERFCSSFGRAVQGVECWIQEGIEAAMNRFNRN